MIQVLHKGERYDPLIHTPKGSLIEYLHFLNRCGDMREHVGTPHSVTREVREWDFTVWLIRYRGIDYWVNSFEGPILTELLSRYSVVLRTQEEVRDGGSVKTWLTFQVSGEI